MNGALLLAIEIGGTKLQLAVGRGDGRLLGLERRSVDAAAGAAGIREQIRATVVPLLAPLGLGLADVGAVGIGFGGPVDATRGVVLTSNQIDGWDQFPLAEWIRETLGVPHVALQNDADTAGLGEAQHGAGVGCSPLLYVTVGSGIGGGLILGGQIYRGSGAGAAEVGQLWVSGEAGEAPRRLEQLASGWSIGRAAAEELEARQHSDAARGFLAQRAAGDRSRVTAELVATAAHEGDPLARHILARAARALGEGLAQAVTLLAPRRIVVGGGVSLIEDALWLGPVREQLDRLVFPPFRGTYDVVRALLGEEVVIHGALALAQRMLA